MKRIIGFAAILALAAGTAAAQQPTGLKLNVSSGIGLPTAPSAFKDFWKTAFGFGAGLEVPILTRISLGLNGQYHRFALDADAILEDAGAPSGAIDVDGGAADTWILTGDVKGALLSGTGRIMPFLTAGIGYMRLAIDDVFVDGELVDVHDLKDDAFALRFGGGLDIGLTDRFAVFADGAYVIGFTEDERTEYVPIRVGASFLLRPGGIAAIRNR